MSSPAQERQGNDRRVVCRQQVLDLLAESVITAAGCLDKRGAISRRELERLFEQLIDLAPALGGHRSVRG